MVLLSNFKPKTLHLVSRAERGLSLVELIVSMVIISVGAAGILVALNAAVRGSADPIVQKQALAIAEALLEEIQLMPFTYCDPDDSNAETATSTAGCSVAEAIGPEGLNVPPTGPAETRTGTVRPFDNVNDYHNFSMTGIVDIAGNPIAGLGAYTASVTVAQQGIPAVTSPVVNAIPAAEALLTTVTVTGPGNVSVRLDGYRTRYAPNLLP